MFLKDLKERKRKFQKLNDGEIQVTLVCGNQTLIMVGLERKKNLGYFETPEEAAKVYDAEAKKRYGEFAFLNFPD